MRAIELIQLTDLHIFGDKSSRLKGVDTGKSMQSVLRLMLESGIGDCDALVLTGDLSQDGSIASYDWLAGQLAPLGPDIYWLPGNHDIKENMIASFTRYARFRPEKSAILQNWLLVFLDSSQAPSLEGYLETVELERLETILGKESHEHALIFLHHNPVNLHHERIDRSILMNADRLFSLITGFPEVRGLVWGHVHEAYDQEWHRLRLLATPSTCVQFRAGARGVEIDSLEPGYRRLRLGTDGSIDTSVFRVQPGN